MNYEGFGFKQQNKATKASWWVVRELSYATVPDSRFPATTWNAECITAWTEGLNLNRVGDQKVPQRAVNDPALPHSEVPTGSDDERPEGARRKGIKSKMVGGRR